MPEEKPKTTMEEWQKQMDYANRAVDPLLSLPPHPISDLHTFLMLGEMFAKRMDEDGKKARSMTAMAFAAAILRLRKRAEQTN